MAHIKLNNVSLSYPIYNAGSQSLRNKIVKISTGGKIDTNSDYLTIKALCNITLTISHGDRVGVVGHNGAGKSTLLRVIAGIYQPTEGCVDSFGSVSTILDLGAGLDPELSGYENIYRMGLLMRKSMDEISQAIPDIEQFTELGGFLETPVRTYSSGMMMRLMFAVATSIRPDILIIDEMFGTGDASFQEKAVDRMHKLMNTASIVIFSSHSIELLKKYCNKFVVLEHGTLIKFTSEL